MIKNKNTIFSLSLLFVFILFYGTGCQQKQVFHMNFDTAGTPQPPGGGEDSKWSVDKGPEQSGNFKAVTTADFNNDGIEDILGGGNPPGQIFLWLGDGRGGWIAAQRFPIDGDIRSLQVGDINKDGWLDVVSTSQGNTKGIQTWINVKGEFQMGKPVDEMDIYEGIRLVDLNNDGNLDIVAANIAMVEHGGIQVWFGDGKGNFPTETGPTRDGKFQDVGVADFNNDGKLDIVGAGANALNYGLYGWLGSGDGRWSLYRISDVGSHWGISLADLDGDGNVDIVGATSFDGVYILYGEGNGLFRRKEVLVGEGSYWRVKTQDFNGDGLLDIVATSSSDEGVHVWYQGKGGGWTSSDEGLPRTGFFYDVAVQDMNGDGLNDMTVASYGEGVRVWLREDREQAERLAALLPSLQQGSVSEKGNDKAQLQLDIQFDATEAAITEGGDSSLKLLALYLKGTPSADVKLYGSSELTGMIVQALEHTGIQKKRFHAVIKDNDKIPTVKKGEPRIVHVEVRDPLAEEKKGVLPKKMKEEDNVDLHEVNENSIYKMVNGVAEYKIGPGDKLHISLVEGGDVVSYDVNVTATGQVSFSFVNDFKIAGMTIGESQNALNKMMGEYIREPNIRLAVTERHAYSVSILGAVRSLQRQPTGPGVYTIGGKETITQFISRAGGHADNADLSRVQVTRNRKTYYLDLFKALFKGDFRQDIILNDGDVIFIPSKSEDKKKIFVMGEVMKPGILTFNDDMTLMEALINVGGPTFYGNPNLIVIRGDETKQKTLRINYEDIIEKGDFRKNITLKNGDILYVAKSALGNMRDFMKTLAPVFTMMRLPMEAYSASTLPSWEGIPLRRTAPSSVSSLRTTPSTTATEGGAWSTK